MDSTTTLIALPLLSALGGWFSGYMQGYMSQKGKNLATHEDIDKLVDQVKAVTQTTKEIEAKISDQVWDRQRRWELKRDLILKAAEITSIAKDCLIAYCVRVESVKKAKAVGKKPDVEAFSHDLDQLNSTLNELNVVAMTLKLVCGPQTLDAVRDYSAILRNITSRTYQLDVDAGEVLRAETMGIAEKHFNVLEALRSELESQ